ncbi:MAG: PfkB family carbohydrate kinase [Chitinophagales bacterium]|jgi:sugar/nucleoside kinase (ribokinase family)|nr:PfkB family carbohydrate kinase [Chitinophagales bacterium]
MSITIVGTVAFDAIKTPFGQTDKIIGGAATYIGYAAAYFYKPIQIVSIIGGDFDMNEIQEMNNRGIDTQGIEVKHEGKTFFWSGSYHMDMNSRDTLVTELNVLLEFNPILPENYKNTKYLLLGNIDPSLQLKVIEQMTERPKLIVLDTMNFWMEPDFLDTLKKVIAKVDVVTINDAEARQLSGEYSLKKAAKKILAMGPKYLIIKKGEHGALLFNENEMFSAPGLPLDEVFDPTGAGDTFAGGFIGYIAKQDDISMETLKSAVIYGSTLASFCVEKFGTERLKSLNETDIQSRVQQFVTLAKFNL